MSKPVTLRIGAAREWKQRSVTRAAISEATPAYPWASAMTTARPVERTAVAMSGGGGASGSLAVYEMDHAGNWPMRLRVSGLAEGRYALWLTRGGKLAEPCGTFAVASGRANVPLNAPYKLRAFDGWVVVPAGERAPVLTT